MGHWLMRISDTHTHPLTYTHVRACALPHTPITCCSTGGSHDHLFPPPCQPMLCEDEELEVSRHILCTNRHSRGSTERTK